MLRLGQILPHIGIWKSVVQEWLSPYVATFLACSQSVEEAGKGDPMVSVGDSGKLQVTATVNMVSDLVRRWGDHVEVTEIMGPGVDPHLYKASANDVTKLQNAEHILCWPVA